MFSIFTEIMSRVTHSEPGLPMVKMASKTVIRPIQIHLVDSKCGKTPVNHLRLVLVLLLIKTRWERGSNSLRNYLDSCNPYNCITLKLFTNNKRKLNQFANGFLSNFLCESSIFIFETPVRVGLPYEMRVENFEFNSKGD